MYSSKDSKGVTHFRAKLTLYSATNGKKLASFPELYVGDKIKFRHNVTYSPSHWQNATVIEVHLCDNGAKTYCVELPNKTRQWINGLNWIIKFKGI